MKYASALRPWLIVAALAALLGWWAAPLPEPPAGLVKPRQDSWRLAPLPRRIDQTSTAAVVSSASYWGATAASPAASAPIEDPRWRIAAVYGSGKDRGALVLFAAANKPPLRLRVGDVLPSGHRIVSIGDREVCVQIGRKAFRLGVQRSES